MGLFVSVEQGKQYCFEVKHGAQGKRDGNCLIDRRIHGEGNVLIIVQG